jgi:hypothetical protein
VRIIIEDRIVSPRVDKPLKAGGAWSVTIGPFACRWGYTVVAKFEIGTEDVDRAVNAAQGSTGVVRGIPSKQGEVAYPRGLVSR